MKDRSLKTSAISEVLNIFPSDVNNFTDEKIESLLYLNGINYIDVIIKRGIYCPYIPLTVTSVVNDKFELIRKEVDRCNNLKIKYEII